MSDSGDRIIADRYRLTALLGQGGMGSVWRATHLNLGSEVAIKLINPAVADNPEVQERFVREAKAAAGLSSPHVVQVMDYGVDGDTPYIVMELLQGESLSERLDAVGKLSLEDTARIITEVARALTKAHEAGIVHRDLKPDNVFLVKNDDTEIAKVLDFGVAKDTGGMERAHMTSTGDIMGTPFYMSPEQAEGAKGVDQRTDIWALGVITYECILGARPFGSETLAGLFLAICTRPMPVPSYRGTVPPGFDAWFEKATARNPEERFSSVKEAAAALRDVCLPDRESRLPPLTAQTIGGKTTLHLTTPDEPRILQSKGDVSQMGAAPSARMPRADSDTLASHTHDRRKHTTKLRGPLMVFFGAVSVGVLIVGLRSGDSSADGREQTESSTAVEVSAAPQSIEASPASVSAPARELGASEPGASEPSASEPGASEPGARDLLQSPPEAKPIPSPSRSKDVAAAAPKTAPVLSASQPTVRALPSAGQMPAPASTSTRAPAPAPKEKPRFDLGI